MTLDQARTRPFLFPLAVLLTTSGACLAAERLQRSPGVLPIDCANGQTTVYRSSSKAWICSPVDEAIAGLLASRILKDAPLEFFSTAWGGATAKVYQNSNGHLAITNPVFVDRSVTDGGTWQQVVTGHITQELTANNDGDVFPLYGSAWIDPGRFGKGGEHTSGVRGTAAMRGSHDAGAVEALSGVIGLVSNSAKGHLRRAVNFTAQQITNPGTGTIGSAYAFYDEGTSAAIRNYGFFFQNNSGINTHKPDRPLEINSATGLGMRLTYADNDGDAASYVDLKVTSTGNATITPSGGVTTITGTVLASALGSTANCADGAGDAACGSAPAGSVVIDVADTETVVFTTAVTANSQVFVFEDSSLGNRLSVACNTTIARTYAITARTGGKSFTIKSSAAPDARPACLSYLIVN